MPNLDRPTAICNADGYTFDQPSSRKMSCALDPVPKNLLVNSIDGIHPTITFPQHGKRRW